MVYSDCHAHLDLFRSEDADLMIERGRKAGVKLAVAASINCASSYKTLNVARRNKIIIRAAAGIHPRIVQGTYEVEIQEVLDLACQEKVAAIGEVGLDYRQSPEAEEKQVNVFRRFLEVGERTGKPLFVHILDAFEDAIRIIDEYPEARGAIHCFSGSLEQAREFADRDFYPSISNAVLLDPSSPVRKIAAKLELDRMVVDTDTLPGTFEVRHAVDITEVIAREKNLPAEEVGDAVTLNLMSLLGET